MKILRLLTAVICCVCMTVMPSCKRNEFDISLDISGATDINLRVLYYASSPSGGALVESVIAATHGKGELKGVTKLPTLVYIFQGMSNTPALIVYAERGDRIEITGSGPDPRSWNVGGNSLNDDWTAWRHANAGAISSSDPAKVNAAVRDYVRAHRDSPLSAALLLTTFDRRSDGKLWQSLWQSLEKGASSEELATLSGRCDVAAGTKADNLSENMRLHAYGDSLVSLKPSAHRATLLFFWRKMQDYRQSDIDSLKALTRSTSGGRVISISFETDSATWKRTARADSLTKGTDAWMPAAEADTLALRLGVPRTPFFIVADSRGRQLYRGSDISDAIARYRALTSRPERSPAKKPLP